jgi:H+-transporting ATPase
MPASKDDHERNDDFEHASPDAVLADLGADVEKGLGEEEARRRLAERGPNAIEQRRRSAILKFLSYFWGPIPWMLEAACVLAGVAHHWEELFVVFAMLLINGGVGFVHEHRAASAIDALKQTLAPQARVIRAGRRRTIAAREVVPGDLIVVRRGDVVPADAKLLEGDLSLDESALTGESLPVDKQRGGVVYSSTAVKRGEARAVVVGTGAATHFGRTVELVAGVQERSHFERAVMRIGYFLMGATALVVAGVVIVEVIRGRGLVEVLLFALILTVAGIPVALPAVLSVTMAAGARRLASQKAVVSRLAAMEDLAGVDLLLSDKTGTLTQNRLQLQQSVPIEAREPDEIILAAALTAERGPERDAIDAAVLDAIDAGALAEFHVEELSPFDSTRKRAEAMVRRGQVSFEVAKGAPQVILDLCRAGDGLRQEVGRKVEELGDAGLRALGVARESDGHWRYLGLLSLLDPPREDSARVVHEALEHDVDVRMITGDHEAIARQVARRVGLGADIEPSGAWVRARDDASARRLFSADGIAEVTPEDKYAIVDRFQRSGRMTAMTGDGVNDAPALKKADVGLAVSGAAEAARAAADIVLTLPGLGVIIGAIEEARRIFVRMVSYSTFRIAETIRMVLFIAGSIVFVRIYPVTAIMVALLAILNDIPIMTIAADKTLLPRRPVRWNMKWLLADASLLGLTGVVASFLFLWFVHSRLGIELGRLQTLLFLKLLVAGHMTIYVTRVRDWFWRRPWPDSKLLVALESTQVLGTLAAVYGVLVTPIGWWLALGVWAYALAWTFLLSAVRVLAYRLLRPHLESRPRSASGRKVSSGAGGGQRAPLPT